LVEVIVVADASEHGLGAVIQHQWSDGSVKAIVHASCLLKSAKQNYSQIENEGLALIFTVKTFYKYNIWTALHTSHRSSTSLSIFGSRKGIPAHSENSLQHWAATILGYDFKMENRKSTDFGQADALYRLISSHSTPDEEVVIAALQAEFDMDMLTSYLPVTFDKLRSIPRRMNCYSQ
jgi:hypothetical protein